MPEKEPARYQMAHRVVVIAFVLGAMFIGIYQLIVVGVGTAWMGFISVLYLFIPLLLRKLLRLRPAYLPDIVLYIFIFIAFDLGVALRLYTTPALWWYDLVVHFLSGLVFTGVGLCFYGYIRADRTADMGADRRVAAVFSFCFSQFIAVIWELIEYAGFVFFGHDSQDMANGVKDTMEDMMACLLGSLILAVLIRIHLRGKRRIFLLKPVDEFYRVNFGSKEKK